jgi:glycerol kinase
LLNNVLFSNEYETHYVTEGSINACNSLFYWLEDELNIPHKDMEWDKRCSQTETNGVLVSGFSGLAAPYWKSGFETVFHQLENVSNNEIIRAGMESIGYLVNDIIKAMPLQECPDIIPASGGGARKPLLQFISDITENSIGHSSMKDRTAFGVLNLLKKAAGESILHETVECDHIFTPQIKDSLRQVKLDQWHTALRKAEIF